MQQTGHCGLPAAGCLQLARSGHATRSVAPRVQLISTQWSGELVAQGTGHTGQADDRDARDAVAALCHHTVRAMLSQRYATHNDVNVWSSAMRYTVAPCTEDNARVVDDSNPVLTGASHAKQARSNQRSCSKTPCWRTRRGTKAPRTQPVVVPDSTSDPDRRVADCNVDRSVRVRAWPWLRIRATAGSMQSLLRPQEPR